MASSKDGDRPATWASVLDKNEVVNIVVLGDAGVGKTTLIQVYVSDVFTGDGSAGYKSVLDPIKLEQSLNFKCPLLIRDTSSQLGDDATALKLALEEASVAVLCYAVDQPRTFNNLSTYWLPHIERFKPSLPVLLVATKRDLDSPIDEREADVGEEAFIYQTEPLLTQFRCVERAIRCSAKYAVDEVHAVFNQATHMVMFPSAPLYDEHRDVITPEFSTALTRIFRIFDTNRDGVLSLAELGVFQQRTFGLKLAETDTLSVIEVIKEEFPQGVVASEDGYSLNEDGFKRLVLMFVMQGHPESAWSVLKTFDYDRHLNLKIPDFDLPLSRPDQSAILSPLGASFVEEVFIQFSKDHTMSTSLARQVFRIAPSESHPFGPEFPFNTRCSSTGALVRDSWTQLWRMAAMVSPKLTMQSLYCLGFGLSVDMDASKALVPGPPRKAEGTMSHERRCFVVGSSGVGKSSLVRHFLNGPSGLRQQPPRPTTSPVHSVKRPPQSSKSEVEAFSVPEEVLAARPSTLVITEYPADQIGRAMEDAKWQCDVLCFVVDPSSDASINVFEESIDMIPDLVPTFVVAAQHGVESDGTKRLRELCQTLRLDILDFTPRSPAGQSAEIFQFAAGLAPTMHVDNPQTAARVQRAAKAQMWRRLWTVGFVTVALVTVGGVAALTLTKSGRQFGKSWRAKLFGSGSSVTTAAGTGAGAAAGTAVATSGSL